MTELKKKSLPGLGHGTYLEVNNNNTGSRIPVIQQKQASQLLHHRGPASLFLQTCLGSDVLRCGSSWSCRRFSLIGYTSLHTAWYGISLGLRGETLPRPGDLWARSSGSIPGFWWVKLWFLVFIGLGLQHEGWGTVMFSYISCLLSVPLIIHNKYYLFEDWL